jgi:hypothetical protein
MPDYLAGFPGIHPATKIHMQKWRLVNKVFVNSAELLQGTVILSLFLLCWTVIAIMRCRRPPLLPKYDGIYLHRSNDHNLQYVPRIYTENLLVLKPPQNKFDLGSWASYAVNITQVASRKDVVCAALYSFCAAYVVIRSLRISLLPYLLMAPDWFVSFLVLARLNCNNLWISNQKDRWAVLVDEISPASFTIVQHGLLKSNKVNGIYKFNFPLLSGLNNVTRIFCIDNDSVADFKNLVLGRSANPEFIVLHHQRKIVPWTTDSGLAKRILVIGGPTVYELARTLSREIKHSLGDNYVVGYRPSPLEMSTRKKKYDDYPIIMPTDDSIPDADIVLDYGSSLLNEILAVKKVKVISWDIYDKSSIDNVLSTIKTLSCGVNENN